MGGRRRHGHNVGLAGSRWPARSPRWAVADLVRVECGVRSCSRVTTYDAGGHGPMSLGDVGRRRCAVRAVKPVLFLVGRSAEERGPRRPSTSFPRWPPCVTDFRFTGESRGRRASIMIPRSPRTARRGVLFDDLLRARTPSGGIGSHGEVRPSPRLWALLARGRRVLGETLGFESRRCYDLQVRPLRQQQAQMPSMKSMLRSVRGPLDYIVSYALRKRSRFISAIRCVGHHFTRIVGDASSTDRVADGLAELWPSPRAGSRR